MSGEDRVQPKPAEERYRMRRLTDDELEAICTTARSKARGRGPVKAMRMLWDLILREAEGVSVDEAAEAGLRFHVADFQIAASQARLIERAMVAWRGPRAVAFLWLNDSPGEYDDDEPAYGVAHTTEQPNAHEEGEGS